MSLESAKAFVVRMKTDKEFAARMGKAETKEERWTILEAEGFKFTKDEFDAAYDELNDEALLVSDGSVLRSRECVCCKF